MNQESKTQLTDAINRLRNEVTVNGENEQFGRDILLVCDALCKMEIRLTAANEALAWVEIERDELRIGRLYAGQNIANMRMTLKEAHDAMFSWFSSEFSSHPLSRKVADALLLGSDFVKEVDQLKQECDTLQSQLTQWKEVAGELAKWLKFHHKHQLESTRVFFEQDGKPVGEIATDLGEAYSESSYCEPTTEALTRHQQLLEQEKK